MYLSLLAELAHRHAGMQGSGDCRRALLFSIPSLLDEDVLAFLYHELSGAEDPEQPLLAVFHELIAVRTALDEGDTPWLFGFGPMEGAVMLCGQGDHTWEEAAARLRKDDFQSRFSPEYADRLGFRYLDRARHGEWREIIEPMRLLLAVTQGWGGDNGFPPFGTQWEDARVAVRLHWINLVKEVLCHESDGRLLREAKEQARLLLEEAEAAGNARMKEAAAYAAGTLHLDPCSAGLSTANAAISLKRRGERFMLQNQSVVAGLPEEEWRMPPMEEALATAATYLETALVKPPGVMRGAVLKALAQTCVWQKSHGWRTARDVREVCHEALRHLNGEKEADLRDAVLHYLHTEEAAPAAARDAGQIGAACDFAVMVREAGADPAFQRVHRAIIALLPGNAGEAWALGRPFWTEIDRLCPENERLMFAETMLNCAGGIARHRKLAPFDGMPVRPGQHFSDYVEDFRQRERRSDWTDTERLLAVLNLAGPASKLNSEGPLLELLRTITTGKEVYEEFKPLVRYLRGMLHQGEGASAWNRKDSSQAAVHYCKAIEAFLEDGRHALAFDCLGSLRDVAHAGLRDYETALNLSVFLSLQAGPLSKSLGAVTTEPLQWLFKRVAGGLATPAKTNLEAILFVTQSAKAAAFAFACTKPGERGPLDEAGKLELAHIESLRAEHLESVPVTAQDAEAAVDDGVLLVSYVEPMAKAVDSSTGGRLTFASRRFDQREFMAASGGGLADGGHLHNIEELQRNLGNGTVLLNFFLTVNPDEHEAWLVMGFTSEESFAGIIQTDWPSGTLHMSDRDRKASLSAAGMSVHALRSAIQGKPPAPAVPGALQVSVDELLESSSRQFMGAVIDKLAALRTQGKNHLCIVPHGALHYLPFHLLSPGGKPLADDWTVSYLPALQFLRRYHTTGQRTGGAAVFGLDFDEYNPHRQATIPDVATETRQIAALLGSQAILNERATQERFTEALRTCRFVHLATHGGQEVQAPAFHNVLLAEDAASDGRLEAHDLARMDLRGLELLTLSACETSLGRFDLADNPRGIPASLFQAGAETLIGTLWPVASNTARHFYINFYQGLAEGRGKLDAFRIAQQATRQTFPAYRHWGAFTFSGRWREGSSVQAALPVLNPVHPNAINTGSAPTGNHLSLQSGE